MIFWKHEKRGKSNITFYESEVELSERESVVLLHCYNTPLETPIYINVNGYLCCKLNGHEFINKEKSIWLCAKKSSTDAMPFSISLFIRAYRESTFRRTRRLNHTTIISKIYATTNCTNAAIEIV